MSKDITTVTTEDLEEARTLLSIHVLGCKVYELLGESTYHDGQPVEQAKASAIGMIEWIDGELERRK